MAFKRTEKPYIERSGRKAGLGMGRKAGERHPQHQAGKPVDCICPKCHKHHKFRFFYTGRLPARKFCNYCQFRINEGHIFDEYEPNSVNYQLKISQRTPYNNQEGSKRLLNLRYELPKDTNDLVMTDMMIGPDRI